MTQIIKFDNLCHYSRGVSSVNQKNRILKIKLATNRI